MPNPRTRFTLAAFGAVLGAPPLPAQPHSCTDGYAAGFPCHAVDLQAVLTPRDIGAADGVRLNDVWGWADPETGREYALVGRTDGTAIVDVTDAANPRYLGNLAMTEGSRASAWRDIKVFRDHAFVVADGAGQHGMQVFDLTALRELEGQTEDAPPRTFAADATWKGISTTMNLAINAETGFAYLADASGDHACPGLLIVDLNEPLDPVPAGCFWHLGTGRTGTGRAHDAHCVLYRGPDSVYRGREICIGFNETAISVADLTDPQDPVAIAAADYPNVGYAHQGWLTEDHRHLYSTDEMDELSGLVPGTRILVWDMTRLGDPVPAAEHIGPNAAIDHNLLVRGNRVFVAANRGGLRVLDIAEREAPVEAGHFVTVADSGEAWAQDRSGAGGARGVHPFLPSGIVLVSSRDEGFFVLRVR